MTVESFPMSWLATDSTIKTKNQNLPVESQSAIDIKQVFDKKTGLTQIVVTHTLSNEVLHKSPSDEYLRLLTVLKSMDSLHQRV